MTRFCFISRVAAAVSKSKDCEKERNREIDRNGNKSRNAKKKYNKGKWKDQWLEARRIESCYGDAISQEVGSFRKGKSVPSKNWGNLAALQAFSRSLDNRYHLRLSFQNQFIDQLNPPADSLANNSRNLDLKAQLMNFPDVNDY